MSEDVVDDFGFELLSMKDVQFNVTSFLDLSDQILLKICRYLPPSHILYSFYTPLKPDFRLHRLICDYYKNVKLDGITNNQYNYLSSLFCCSTNSLPIESLILSNEHVNCLIERFFLKTPADTISSIFNNLKCLKLIDLNLCNNVYFDIFIPNLEQLECLYMTCKKTNQEENFDLFEATNTSINDLLFNDQVRSLKSVDIEIADGILLNKSLISHHSLTNVNLVLQTIDDLYILLDGLVPNVQTMTIQLCRSRILCCDCPKSRFSCPQLIEFTLLEPRIGFVISDVKSILGYMRNLIKLTLSIRDTPDPIFTHGPAFESILNEYLPNLDKFDYTMTHRIVDQSLIEDFVQWPMKSVYYSNENCQWIHIYSIPWPSDENDQRKLPIVKDGCNSSVTSDVKRSQFIDHISITKQEQFALLNTQFSRVCRITTCLSIDIQFPLRIYKLILSKDAHISSTNYIIQPSIQHLIVQRRLDSEAEIEILAQQFPSVGYLELLFPLNKSSYNCCLKNLFKRDKNIQAHWSQLIVFSTELFHNEFNFMCSNNQIFNWLIQNTDLKYHKYPFYVHASFSQISIWF